MGIEEWLAEQDWKDLNPRPIKTKSKQRILQKKTAGRRTRQRGASVRASAASGDSNSDDPEPESERRTALYDQEKLADILGISKKTIQNIFSRTPDLLPPAIKIPGTRGPRWTAKSVEKWLDQQPVYVAPTIPVVADAQKRKAGRPRIVAAQCSAGGAA